MTSLLAFVQALGGLGWQLLQYFSAVRRVEDGVNCG